MVVEDHDWADSSDSSDDEEDTINLGLMALNDEVDLGLIAKIEDIPEEAVESSSLSASTSATQVPLSSNSSNSLSALDSLTVDLYNVLNGKTKAESANTDLRDQLSTYHQRIKELTIFEENLRDQVIVNQLLCIEREQAIAEREKAISDLNSERNTIKGVMPQSLLRRLSPLKYL